MKANSSPIKVDFSHYIYESKAPNTSHNEYFTSAFPKNQLKEGVLEHFYEFSDKHLRHLESCDCLSIVDNKHIRRETGLVVSYHVLLLMGILLIAALALFITFIVKYLLKNDCASVMKDKLICIISGVSALVFFVILAAFYLLHTKPRVNESIVRNKINFEANLLLESDLASK